MTNRWKINGTDIFAAFGAAVKSGSYLDIISPPTPRKRLEYDYIDQNGAKVDTTAALTYEPRRYSLKMAIIAGSYTDFWAKYNSLIGAMATPGTFTFYVSDIGVTCNLLYEGAKCTAKSRTFRSGKIAVELEISVFEPNPKTRTYDPS